MEEWKQYRLIDILDKLIDYRGKTPKKTTSGIPLITAKIIKNGRIDTPTEFISVDDYDSWMVRGFPKVGDVVLTTEAPLGEVAQLDNENIALAQRVVTLRGKAGVLDNTYLKYYLMSNVGQQRIKARETGTTVTGIKQSELREVLVDCPPYQFQQKIASILKSLDDKIEVNRQINDNLEQQAQALFKSWFIDFEPFKDGEFVKSELGMIPKGWRVGTIGDMAKITSGKRPPIKESKRTNYYKYPLIGASCIMGYTSEYLYNSKILVTGRVGTHGVVMRYDCQCWPSDNTLVIQSSYYEFIYQCLKNIDYNNLNRGSTQPLITQTDLKNTVVVIPSESILYEFEIITKALMNKVSRNRCESDLLAELRDTLLPRLMSGELNV